MSNLDFFDGSANIVRICRLSGWIIGGSLLKAAVNVSVNTSFSFEGKRNGGLDFSKPPIGTPL
ncbi:hypothetical protein NE647_18745 [Blautia coccoides]|uniref:hypothetical protein n=1 Tax=Lachnospiraceae TaxID=186803 RepID=UPI0012F92D44|nr:MULTISPECIES: hypothetical protein [Lachnospiraceae]MCQ4642458.1 hypothetical protein [Blautia coccoides]MCQ5124051.1 hypothetical protein [Blautia producta]